MRIKSNGHTVTITGKANSADLELIQWAAANLGFVNGIVYDVDGQQWIENIKATYDENVPQIKTIISVINAI